MSTLQTIAQRFSTRRSQTLVRRQATGELLTELALFLLALAPRAVALGRFLTIDEAYHWFDRARLFGRAIRAGDWAGTNLIGHPGVTTMWLGALGVATHQALAAWGLATWPDPDLLRFMLRLPVALVTSLCVALGYGLLRRLVAPRVALLAALLWAGDPFLVAHSQLLHVDALLTSFMSLALLAALLAFRMDNADGQPLHWRLLIGSGVAGGLALLTKSPSIILLPMVGLIGLVAAWRHWTMDDGRWTIGERPHTIVYRLSSFVVLPLLAWLAVAALVWVALWPAAWVDLPGAIGSVVHQAEADGGSPHGWGNFFLGRAVADPGPLFYPLAIALRLTPWVSIGLIAAAVAAIQAGRRGRLQQHAPLGLLAAFALVFVVMLSVAAKKFDRYALPVFPALDILAAAGLIWIADCRLQIVDWLTRKSKKQPEKLIEVERMGVTNPQNLSFSAAFAAASPPRKQRRGDDVRGFAPHTPPFQTASKIKNLRSKIGWIAVVLALLINLAWYHPYELAYYNPLLGGGPVAARLIPVGWGEGLELAGAFIAAQPDGAERPVATWYRPALKPYISAPLVPLGDVLEPGKVGYAVLYIDQVQRRDDAAATDLLRSQLTPIRTIRIHGIDYAEIYQVPLPAASPIDADFGPAIHLRGYNAGTPASGALALTVHWQARAAVKGDLMLFVHLLDARGRRVGGVDVPPGGAGAPTSAWQPGRYISAALQVPVEPNLASGAYWLAIGLYDPATGARLSLRAAPQPGAPGDGENALLLGPLTIK